MYRFLYKEEFLFLEEKKEFSFSEKEKGEREIVKERWKNTTALFFCVLVNRWGIIFFYWNNTYLIFKKLENVMIILKGTHYRKCYKNIGNSEYFYLFKILFFTYLFFTYCNILRHIVILFFLFIKLEFKNGTLKLPRKWYGMRININ